MSCSIPAGIVKLLPRYSRGSSSNRAFQLPIPSGLWFRGWSIIEPFACLSMTTSAREALRRSPSYPFLSFKDGDVSFVMIMDSRLCWKS